VIVGNNKMLLKNDKKVLKKDMNADRITVIINNGGNL